MAIPHVWTSISHLLFKGRGYWQIGGGPLLGPPAAAAAGLSPVRSLSFFLSVSLSPLYIEMKCVTFGLGPAVGVSLCTHRNSQRSKSGNNLTAANASLFLSGLRPHTVDYSHCHVSKAVGCIGICTARFGRIREKTRKVSDFNRSFCQSNSIMQILMLSLKDRPNN